MTSLSEVEAAMDFEPVIPAPSQRRSQEALERFLQVAQVALLQNTFEETSVADFAKLADSSVGSFYRVIGDKEILLIAVHQRFLSLSKERVDALLDPERWEGMGIKVIISAFVSEIISAQKLTEGLMRALIRRSSTDPAFRERIHLLNAYISAKFVPLIMDRREEMRHSKPEQAAAFLSQVVLGAMNHYTLAGLGDITESALQRELTLLACRYLGLED